MRMCLWTGLTKLRNASSILGSNFVIIEHERDVSMIIISIIVEKYVYPLINSYSDISNYCKRMELFVACDSE